MTGSQTSSVLKLMASLFLVCIYSSAFTQDNAPGKRRLVFYFEYNSSEPDPSTADNLNELKTWLSTVEIDSVRIEGNTDETGDVNYNYDLGTRRAKAIEIFLKGYSPAAY